MKTTGYGLHIRTIAVAFGLAILTSGWSNASLAQSDAAWQKTIAAARKEGKLVIYYQAVPIVIDRLVKDFQSLYPEIKIEGNRQVTLQALTVLDEERKAGIDGADITQFSNSIWHKEHAAAGAFMAPTGPSTKEWPADHLLYGTVVAYAVQPFVMAYNTNLVKTPVTGIKDILRPEFKGQLGTSDVIAETTVAWYEWLEKTQGPGFIEKFAAQKPRLYNGSVPATQSLAAGEIAFLPYTVKGITSPMLEKGAPIKVVITNPSFASRDVMAALTWSKRPNAALVFLDYIMSRRGQTVLAGGGDFASPLPGIPGSLDVRTMNSWDPNKYPAEVVKPYVEKFNRLFKG